MAFLSRYASISARCLALATLALITSAAAPARAGSPGARIDPKAAARSQADRGFELFEAGSYVEAAQAFRLAEVLFHAPTLVFAIGRAESKAGHLLEAREAFKRVIDEKIAPSAPPEYLGAQASAQGELAAVEARIARVTITVDGAAGRAFVVDLDDAVIAPSALEKPIEIDPGAHRIVVLPAVGATEKRDVIVADGARETVAFSLAPLPSSGIVIAPKPTPPKGRDLLVPAVISLGVGVAGVGVGAALGGITLAKTSAIRAHCIGDVCPRDQESAASGARTTATISTVAFIAGGAFAAAGVTLLVLRPKARSPSPSIGLTLAPGGLVAQGSF